MKTQSHNEPTCPKCGKPDDGMPFHTCCHQPTPDDVKLADLIQKECFISVAPDVCSIFRHGPCVDIISTARASDRERIAELEKELAEWKQITANREVTLKQEGEAWVRAKTETDEVKAKLTLATTALEAAERALTRIDGYPVHSEPVGAAGNMSDIAHEALTLIADFKNGGEKGEGV